MSFDNYYPNRKDRRKPYRKARRFSSSCRNHGSCGYCMHGRLYNKRKTELAAIVDIQDYLAEAE